MSLSIFPEKDVYWSDTVKFITKYLDDSESLIAPADFSAKFDNVYAYSEAQSASQASWIIIHKGMIEHISHQILYEDIYELSPVFANEVFVVFSNKNSIPAISQNNMHIKSLREKLVVMKQALKSFSSSSELTVSKIATVQNNSSLAHSVYLGDYRALTRNFLGQKMIVDTRDLSLTPHILADGYWEMWITKAFMKMLSPGMTVVEVGANIGYYTLIAASKVGESGQIHAFEANPQTFKTLFENIAVNGFIDRTKIIQKAVYKDSRKLSFHCLKKHHGSSSIIDFEDSFTEQYMDEKETVEVDALSLDEYFSPGTKIDLIKIDAEGSEPYIFHGMKRVIDENPNIKVLFEFAPFLISGAGNDPKMFLHDLNSKGFKIQIIDTNSSVANIQIDDALRLPHCEILLSRS